MKTKLAALAVTGFIVGLFSIGCGSSVENKKEEVKEAQEQLQNAETEYVKERDSFKTEATQKIESNKREIAVLKERMKERPKKIKEKYRTEIDELERKNDNLEQRIANVEAENRREQWEEFKREFNHDMDELGTALKDFGKDNTK